MYYMKSPKFWDRWRPPLKKILKKDYVSVLRILDSGQNPGFPGSWPQITNFASKMHLHFRLKASHYTLSTRRKSDYPLPVKHAQATTTQYIQIKYNPFISSSNKSVKGKVKRKFMWVAQLGGSSSLEKNKISNHS